MSIGRIVTLTTVVALGAHLCPIDPALASDADAKRFEEIAKSTLASQDGEVRPRWSKAQRSDAATRLMKSMAAMGIEPSQQVYRVPNDPSWLDVVMPPVSGINVHATLPATVTTRVTVVVGAHYDTVRNSPGANDNGSGIAIILSTMERLRRMPERSMNVQFVFFDQEEGGSFGSRAFAQDALRQGKTIHSVHTADLVGWDGDHDGLVEIDADGEIADLYIAAASRLEIPIKRSRFNSSDHLSFRAEGFLASCLSEAVTSGDMSPHYHSETDGIETVDWNYVARAGVLLESVLTDIIGP